MTDEHVAAATVAGDETAHPGIPTPESTDRLSTGIDVLDERLEGGFLPGSIVLLTADPASQAELFLAQLATPRRTRYVTTRRSVSAIESALERSRVDLPDCEVERVEDGRPLEHTRELVDSMPEGATLIVDTVDALETRDEDRFWEFLNALHDRVTETGSLAVLFGLDGGRVPALRHVTEYAADVVFDLRTEVDGGTLENRLLVPKFRGGEAITQAIKLNLTGDISVDTSRDIA